MSNPSIMPLTGRAEPWSKRRSREASVEISAQDLVQHISCTTTTTDARRRLI